MVGLGNPGSRYHGTRHNVGFEVVRRLAERAGIELAGERYGALAGEGVIAGESCLLLLPQTFMNRSGGTVADALRAHPELDPARDLIVVFDDADLALGRLRLRGSGGSGGHNGLADVLDRVGRRDVARLRFGIGRPTGGGDTRDFVLDHFDQAEWPELVAAQIRAAEAIECFLAHGLAPAMNEFNRALTRSADPPSAAGADRVQSGRNPADPVPAASNPSTMSPYPPLSRTSLADRLSRPFIRFAELETSSAILLLGMALFALAWANSPWGETYESFWHTPFALTLGGGHGHEALFHLELGLGHWVNDALMTIFFFVVGMEIKREMTLGELSSRARAMLPLLGALGGMIVPAGIYAFFHWGEPTIRGWGIPMATDIAFAVAALSLLGSRVPPGLRIFLLALAIADDLGAVAVIAMFYTAEIHFGSLALAGAGLVACAVLNQVGVRSFFVYVAVGAFVWYETHHSGVHATIAGVMLGLLTPTYWKGTDQETLLDRGIHALEHLREVLLGDDDADEVDYGGHRRHHAARQLSALGRSSHSPLDFLVNLLERPVAFFIMPVFALANAGVVLDAATLGEPVAREVAMAVALGLFFGKPIGVTLFSWVAVRTGIAVLPRGVNFGAILATGLLAGIGFTVALFVTALAFEDPVAVAGSKIGILTGSLLATLVGLAVLSAALPSPSTESSGDG